jgi:hypothetical protein
LPRLDQATYSCSGTGNVNDECIFSGGTENIRIEDPMIDGYTVNGMTFMGITFTAFTGYSIELLGIAPTEAMFMNCMWRDFKAEGVARILNADNPPMDLEFDMCSIMVRCFKTISITSGTISQNYFFHYLSELLGRNSRCCG